MKVVVIGGSGLIGRKLVKLLGEAAFEDWLSRSVG
jgi:uncharacterized protein YbjT (DUF2867 family)